MPDRDRWANMAPGEPGRESDLATVVSGLLKSNLRHVEYFLRVPTDRRQREWDETVVIAARHRLGIPWVPTGTLAAELARLAPEVDILVKKVIAESPLRSKDMPLGWPPGFIGGLPAGGPAHLPMIYDGRLMLKWTAGPGEAWWFVALASTYVGKHFRLTTCARTSCGRVFVAPSRRRPAWCPFCLWLKWGMPARMWRGWQSVRDRLRMRPEKEGRLSGAAAVAAAEYDLYRVRDRQMTWAAWREKWDTREGPQGRHAGVQG